MKVTAAGVRTRQRQTRSEARLNLLPHDRVFAVFAHLSAVLPAVPVSLHSTIVPFLFTLSLGIKR